jgi:hypothetical protein
LADNGRRKRKGETALLLALAAGHTVRDAARLARVGERTATRRWAEPAFRRQVVELRAEMIGRALGKLADGMGDAADTLRGLLVAESDAMKLAASRSILDHGARLREQLELEDRLAALERATFGGAS